MVSVELRQKRAKKIAEARAILDHAEKGKRDLTSDESKRYDSVLADAEGLIKRIEREEGLRSIEGDLEKVVRGQSGIVAGYTARGDGTGGTPYGIAARSRPGWEREYELERRHWSEEEQKLRTPEGDYRAAAFFKAIVENDLARVREIMDEEGHGAEARAISTTSGGAGLITPGGFSDQVALLENRVSKMRQLVTVVPTTENSVKVPKVTVSPIPKVAAEAADLTTGVTDPAIGSVTLTPVKIGQIVKGSRELFEDSPLQIANLLSQLIAEAIGDREDFFIINGTPTDFSGNLEDNSTASADTWVDASETLATIASKIYELPLDAIAGASILINVDAAKVLAALTGNDRQVFLPFSGPPMLLGAAEGGFGRLLGLPVRVFPTTTIPANVAFIGDMRAYTLASREELRVQLSTEFAFGTDEFALHVSRRVDGTVTQATRIRKYPAA